jgi:hypothetical protein
MQWKEATEGRPESDSEDSPLGVMAKWTRVRG